MEPAGVSPISQTERTPAENRDAPTGAPPPPLHGEWEELLGQAKTLLRRLGPGGPLAIVAATLPAIGLVTLAVAFNTVGPWLRAQGGWGLAIYTVGFAVCAGLAILPTHIQAMLGGWTFGFAVGFPTAMVGVLGAALIGYAVARRATGERVVQVISEKPKWKAVYDALLGSGFWRSLLIVWLVRCALSPFALTNLVLAATRVRVSVYIIGTLLGLAPRTGVAVFFAVGLKEITTKGPHERWLWIAGVVASVAVVYVIAHIASGAIARVTGANGAMGGATAPAATGPSDTPTRGN